MTKEEIKAKIEELTQAKSGLERDKAVAESELKNIQAKIDEVLPKVEKIVGSTDEGKIKEFLKNLEKDIASDLEKLKSMQEDK